MFFADLYLNIVEEMTALFLSYLTIKGMWIEIWCLAPHAQAMLVTPFTECVD